MKRSFTWPAIRETLASPFMALATLLFFGAVWLGGGWPAVGVYAEKLA